jgi:hypothetical protein
MPKKAKAILILTTLVVALSACSTPTTQPVKVQSLSELAHIHSVATDGKRIFVASHHGLYVLKGNEWRLRGGLLPSEIPSLTLFNYSLHSFAITAWVFAS